MQGTLLYRYFERKMDLLYQETLFVVVLETYEKDALERGKSVHRIPIKEAGWGSLTLDFEG